MKLRVGLVGLGDAWESRHRPALRALGDRFEVKAVCAEVAAKAERVAGEFQAEAVDGFRALAARHDIDALLMLSPDWYGPLPIFAACEHGKAIYCSMAMDIEPGRASEIRERVERAGIAFMAEFPRRQSPATLRLKELIATRLGQPKMLFCHERCKIASSNGVPPLGLSGPSTVRDLMELVDWCTYVVGSSPTSVVGVRHATSGGSDEYQMMSLDFSNDGQRGDGPMAQISCSRYLRPNWQEAISFRPPAQLQICCERGIAFADLPSTVVWFDEAGRHLESLETDRPVGEQMLTQFHRNVTSLIHRTNDLEDAYRALNIVLSAYDSVDQGRRIPLDTNGNA